MGKLNLNIDSFSNLIKENDEFCFSISQVNEFLFFKGKKINNNNKPLSYSLKIITIDDDTREIIIRQNNNYYYEENDNIENEMIIIKSKQKKIKNEWPLLDISNIIIKNIKKFYHQYESHFTFSDTLNTFDFEYNDFENRENEVIANSNFILNLKIDLKKIKKNNKNNPENKKINNNITCNGKCFNEADKYKFNNLEFFEKLNDLVQLKYNIEVLYIDKNRKNIRESNSKIGYFCSRYMKSNGLMTPNYIQTFNRDKKNIFLYCTDKKYDEFIKIAIKYWNNALAVNDKIIVHKKKIQKFRELNSILLNISKSSEFLGVAQWITNPYNQNITLAEIAISNPSISKYINENGDINYEYLDGEIILAIEEAIFLKEINDFDEKIKYCIDSKILFTIIHEIGHTLGLRHNFSGSQSIKGLELTTFMEYITFDGIYSIDIKKYTNKILSYDSNAINYGYNKETINKIPLNIIFIPEESSDLVINSTYFDGMSKIDTTGISEKIKKLKYYLDILVSISGNKRKSKFIDKLSGELYYEKMYIYIVIKISLLIKTLNKSLGGYYRKTDGKYYLVPFSDQSRIIKMYITIFKDYIYKKKFITKFIIEKFINIDDKYQRINNNNLGILESTNPNDIIAKFIIYPLVIEILDIKNIKKINYLNNRLLEAKNNIELNNSDECKEYLNSVLSLLVLLEHVKKYLNENNLLLINLITNSEKLVELIKTKETNIINDPSLINKNSSSSNINGIIFFIGSIITLYFILLFFIFRIISKFI